MELETVKKIALNDVHEQLGAKMTPFAGYNMPVRYTSDIEEHKCVREGVGVFDVSHMGEFMLRGPKALDLIQRVTSNDASKLFDGKAQYSCLPNEDGGVVDDLIVYKIKDEEYLLVVNASNIEKDWNWISERNTEGVEMENISDQMSLFAVQGPKAVEAMQSLTEVNLGEMGFYTFTIDTFAGVSDVIISATGYTGSGGFEIYVKNEDAAAVWEAIFAAGKDYGIQPIGLGARDTLRLEMGYCLYGNDIDDTTSPLEAGLGWITKFTKDFTNSENLKAQKEAGVTRRLVGLKMIDKGIPRQGYEVEDNEGNVIGKITSGTMSPSLGYGIAMAYINKPFDKAETEVVVAVRKRKLKAVVTKAPFLK
ncbi:glycine cleavage system aminomethyltransferase GcvT [Sediminitomix flava]|uniref:Aminomethyltransferase n=1 Tax=Sediminitomix flava TaxID=379075 RepID=A0A315Z6X2_SEDFL|nr:glycine cleavage system aminomethyltransferase GcvT [Sediminitomix flava]PWJ39972.1 aminomethyltransferase [Sediminitomix flava]